MPKLSLEKKEINCQLILDVALELFSANGYCSTSIDNLCEKAKISKGLLYTYFKSKEALFLEMAKRWEEGRNVISPPPRAQYDSLGDALIAVWDEIVEQWTYDNLMFAKIKYEFWLKSSKIPELQNIMRKKSKKSLRIIEDLVRSYVSNPDRDEVTAFARLWWAQIDGLVAYLISHDEVPDSKEMTRIRNIVFHMSTYFDV